MNTIVPTDAAPDAEQEQNDRAVKHKRNLNIALQHAFLIQHQKDVEARILESIEELSEIPQYEVATVEETEAFTRHVSLFQPSNFDELVAERLSQSRCGYTLCGRKPRSLTIRTWRLDPGAADFCSNQCMTKAAHIKSQLSGVPAWERSPTQQTQIVLSQADRDLAVSPMQYADSNTELAFERGEKPSSRKPESVMTAEIVEKISECCVQEAPRLSNAVDSIEGYVPRRKQDRDQVEYEAISPHVALQAAIDGSQSHKLDDEEQQWEDMFAHLKSAGSAQPGM